MDMNDIHFPVTFRPGTFRWRDGKAILAARQVAQEVEQWLVEDPDNAYRHVEKTIEPLRDDTALFLRLADSVPTAESLQRFCYEFGPLIEPVPFLPPSWSGDLPSPKKGSSGIPPSAMKGASLKALLRVTNR